MTTLLATLLLLAAHGLFTACSNDDSDTPSSPAKNELCFDINSQQFTRATVITSNTGLQDQALRISAYHHETTTAYISDAQLVYSGGGWRFDNGFGTEMHYYWPIVGSIETTNDITVGSLDFVGYAPYEQPSYINSLTYYAGNLSFVCAGLPMTSAGQLGITEFMCAYQPNQTKDSNDGTPKTDGDIGKVPMSFKHPFAYVKFQLAASHPNITINSITLKSLKSGGSCSFNGTTSTWSSLTPEGTVDFVMTLTGDDAIFNGNASSEPLTQIGENYIMVPQGWGGEIVVNASWTDWGAQLPHTVSTTLPSGSRTWSAGSSYTYTFTITETDLIVNTEKYTEQW
jgi:hypothetical protein